MKPLIMFTLFAIFSINAQARISDQAYELNRITQQLADDSLRSDNQGTVPLQTLMAEADQAQRSLESLRQEISSQAYIGMHPVSARIGPLNSGETRRYQIDPRLLLRDLAVYAQTAGGRPADLSNIQIELFNGQIVPLRTVSHLNGIRDDFNMHAMIVQIERPTQIRAIVMTTSYKLDWIEVQGR